MLSLKTAKFPADFHEPAVWFDDISIQLAATYQVEGDIAEFGCFEGGLSLRMSWLIKELGLKKTVYALDFFEGFQWDDPHPAGYLVKGAYRPRFDAYSFLTESGKRYPIVPIKGDVSQTMHQLTDKTFSFVWIDVDYGLETHNLMRFLETRMAPGAILGIDDYDRPQTPGMKPAVDEEVATRRWKVIHLNLGAFQIFLQRE